jgi:hypothetical protein
MSWHMRPNSPSPGEKTNEADAVLEREGVQDQAERKYPAQRQSNHLRNASLAHDPTPGLQLLAALIGSLVEA